MGNGGLDRVYDRLEGCQMDMLYQYLEDDKCYSEFTDWLFASKQTEIREALFGHFLNQTKDKQFQDFEAWALDRLTQEEI